MQTQTIRVTVKHDGRVVEQNDFATDKPIWFGREPSCQLILRHTVVSRRHGFIELQNGGQCVVVDESANGMLVDGQPLCRSTRAIASGALLVIGPFEIEVGLPERALRNASRAESNHRLDDHDATPTPVSPVPAAIRRRIHRALLEQLDLARMTKEKMATDVLRSSVLEALGLITDALATELPNPAVRKQLIVELCDEALGLGPLETLLADPLVSEIMVVDQDTVFYESAGKLHQSPTRFTDADSVRAIIERIVTPLGRRIDESSPLVDARLPDGSRVNAVIPPLALRGPCITIRKFARKKLSLADLVSFGAITEPMARLLQRSVAVRKNIVISGGTGSGKTTLLNILSTAINPDERIVTIEDAAELQLNQPHVVSLESKPQNMEGKGAITIRDLLKNALRMRPDRILVGECRGGEALDMLQAMNTGHDGSMTTLHSNSPRDAVSRLETLCLMAGLDLPVRAIRQQIVASVHLIVQQTRFSDGSRRVTSIAEVDRVDHRGEIQLRELHAFERTGTDAKGKVLGIHEPTGIMPSFLDEFITHGLISNGEYL